MTEVVEVIRSFLGIQQKVKFAYLFGSPELSALFELRFLFFYPVNATMCLGICPVRNQISCDNNVWSGMRKKNNFHLK